MKKFFLTLFFAGMIFILLSQGEWLWSKFNFLDAPRVHKIQKGESLSKLAKQYYGDAQFWRELAVVNRAPKPNHVEIGEEILLPSAAVINELSRSRTLTRVNTLVNEQEKVAARTTVESPNEYTATSESANGTETAVTTEKPTAMIAEGNGTTPETTSPESLAPQSETFTEEAEFPWFWLAIGLILVAGVLGFVWYRRKQNRETEPEVETISTPRRRVEDLIRDRRPFEGQERPKEKITV